MRPPLANMRIQFGEETCSHDIRTLLVPVNCFARLIGKTRQVRDPRCELVCEVHISFAGKNPLNLPKRRFLAAPYRGKCRDGQDNTPQEDPLNGHLVLLKHLGLRSQYLRITLNKSRPSSKNQSCRYSMLTLSTAHPDGKASGKYIVHWTDLFSIRRRQLEE